MVLVMRSMAGKHATDDSRLLVSYGRGIGPLGTAARALAGSALVGSVVWGHARDGVDVWAWALGLAALPALTIVLVRWTASRHPGPLVWLAGPVGALTTCGLFMAMYATTWYAPSISVLSDAALVFFGTTMLVAAVRGDAGCEVLAISNWVLRRSDQVGCLLFRCIDQIERPVPGEVHSAAVASGAARAARSTIDR
jgi:hypothetical protein